MSAIDNSPYLMHIAVTVTPTPDATETVQTLTEQPETPEDTGPVNRPVHASDEYLIYQGLSLEGWFVPDLEYAKSYHEFDIILGLTLYDYETETAPKREGYTYDHTEYFKKMNSQESLPLDEIHDFYKNESNDVIGYIRGTDTVVEFNDVYHDCSGNAADDKEKQLTAERFLSEKLGKDFAGTYRLTESLYGKSSATLTYTRYLEGYCTYDEIEINVCKCGKVYNYLMGNANRYNNAEEEISRRRVEYSYEQLKAKVDAMNINVISYGEPRIVLSNNGEFFIEVEITHVDSFSEFHTEDMEVTFRVYYKY